MRHPSTRNRKRAEKRAAERAGRTLAEQVARLDQKLGVGVGAKREREKLAREAGT